MIYQEPVKDKVMVYFRKFMDINIQETVAGL